MQDRTNTILVVDDEDAVRIVATRLLERLQVRTLSAKDAEDALLLLEQHSSEIVGVLIDQTMPRISGDVLARTIIEQYPHIRVILMSGYSATELHQHFGNIGITAFLQKPFSRNELEESVNILLS